jgi:hypothetical protein
LEAKKAEMLFWEGKSEENRRRAASAETKGKAAEYLRLAEGNDSLAIKYRREWEAMKAGGEGDSRRGRNTDR